jgi:hypothetical protein
MSRRPKRRTHLSLSARKELSDKLDQAEKLLERNRPTTLSPCWNRCWSASDRQPIWR